MGRVTVFSALMLLTVCGCVEDVDLTVPVAGDLDDSVRFTDGTISIQDNLYVRCEARIQPQQAIEFGEALITWAEAALYASGNLDQARENKQP